METTNPTNKVNRLLELVKRPQQAKRKPSNFALYWAWAFYNLVALLFDVIAAGTVYDLVGKFVYAILTFAAGFLPLLMHEFLYTRAYANGMQKVLAVIGAGLSVVTILTVGVIAGIVNVLGFSALSTQTLEIVLIVTLVLVSGLHGLIAAIYFYIDDGIKANQVRAESVAFHERRIDDINRAKEILALAEKGAADEDAIAKQYGGAEVLNEVLAQLRGDALVTEDAPVQDKPIARPYRPVMPAPAYAPALKYSLQDLLTHLKKSKDEARALLAEYELDTPQKAFSKLDEYGFLPSQMTPANFAYLYAELHEDDLQPVPLYGLNGHKPTFTDAPKPKYSA